jgi:AraC family transcriptional regulator, regulatory protein of adaptative response / methylated-DNA-[protein]-cysteine methyltransferase
VVLRREVTQSAFMFALEPDISEKLTTQAADYAHVERAITFLSQQWKEQPSIAEIAEAVGLSESHLTAVFRRWAGLSPKALLQALTLDYARSLLRKSASVLDASFESGLSSPARLHDLFVTHEAMSPGEYKARGAGLTLTYGFHPSPFGEALFVTTPRGLAGLGWVEAGEDLAAQRALALVDMQRRWPRANFLRDEVATAPFVARVFDAQRWRVDEPLKVVLIGSDFEISVWQALLTLPLGSATTYADLARQIGKPKAPRAVGAAVGRNPISFVVPCHRVLGSGGKLTGYHWGLTRKQAILGWEASYNNTF